MPKPRPNWRAQTKKERQRNERHSPQNSRPIAADARPFCRSGGAALFSLVLASCAGGGFGGAPDTPAVNPASQPAPVASGPISPASQRNVAEALSGLKLGDETPPISPEDIAVSDDAEILNRNPFSSSAPAARASGWGARADSTRKTQGYKAFEVAVPSENPLMTVAVWISETPPDYPEGKPEQGSGVGSEVFVFAPAGVHRGEACRAG